MATAIRPFRKFQIGMESTKGTLVAATRVIPGEIDVLEHAERYHSDYPRGVRATVGGAGTAVKNWTEVNVETELSAEDILWPLLTGILGAETPSAASSAQTWVFPPTLAAVPTLDAATIEFMRSDGATNHYAREAGYAMTESFKIDSNPDDVARLSWKMFARKTQTTTPTSALVPYTTREPLAGGLLKTYLDTSWAGLGGTQLTGIQRNVSFECMTGVAPDWTADGRSDLDFAKHMTKSLGAKLGIQWEFDSVGASRYANYRANDLVYIRLIWTGSAVSAAVKTVQIDGAYRFASDPTFSEDDEQTIMSADLDAVYDETGTKIVEFTVINALAAVA